MLPCCASRPAPNEITAGSEPMTDETDVDFGPLADHLLHLRQRLLGLRQRGVGVGLEVDLDDAGVHRRHEVAADERHLAQATRPAR